MHRTFGVINKSDGALSVKVQKQKAEGQAEIKIFSRREFARGTGKFEDPRFNSGRRSAFLWPCPKWQGKAMQSLGSYEPGITLQQVRCWMIHHEVMRGSGARRLHEGTRWSMDMWAGFQGVSLRGGCWKTRRRSRRQWVFGEGKCRRRPRPDAYVGKSVGCCRR